MPTNPGAPLPYMALADQVHQVRATGAEVLLTLALLRTALHDQPPLDAAVAVLLATLETQVLDQHTQFDAVLHTVGVAP